MRIIISILIYFSSTNLYSQFVADDILFETKGLNSHFDSLFRMNVPAFIEILNILELPENIKPLKIGVFLNENQFFINLSINFNTEVIYGKGSKYYGLATQYQIYGECVSFYFQYQLLLALSEYKYAVVKCSGENASHISKIMSILTLKKSNGDVMNIHGYNTLGSNSTGLFPFYFYDEVKFRVDGKTHSTKCADLNSLNKFNIFYISEGKDPGGNRTGSYYFKTFFDLISH